jgi:hypothetical protein
MKKIILREEVTLASGEKLGSISLIKLVTGHSPNKQLSVEDMRKRVHILDAIDSVSGNILLLEDEDHRCLADAFQSFPWSAANRVLLGIIDDVLQAENVPTAKLVEKGGKN